MCYFCTILSSLALLRCRRCHPILHTLLNRALPQCRSPPSQQPSTPGGTVSVYPVRSRPRTSHRHHLRQPPVVVLIRRCDVTGGEGIFDLAHLRPSGCVCPWPRGHRRPLPVNKDSALFRPRSLRWAPRRFVSVRRRAVARSPRTGAFHRRPPFGVRRRLRGGPRQRQLHRRAPQASSAADGAVRAGGSDQGGGGVREHVRAAERCSNLYCFIYCV